MDNLQPSDSPSLQVRENLDRSAHERVINHLKQADLIDALRQGLADFNAAPTHVIFLSIIYPIIGLILFRATVQFELMPLLFPILSGFAILGPVAAVGLYEISRLRERGEAISWRNALNVVHARSITGIVVLGMVLAALFGLWLYAAYEIFGAIWGDARSPSMLAFFHDVLTTPAGWKLLIVGGLVGSVFAALAFIISVVSFPLLIDRDTDAVNAAWTSARAVAANPLAMAQWGLIVVVGLIAGSIPLLMGLAVVMPVLGHATWHLYRKVVA